MIFLGASQKTPIDPIIAKLLDQRESKRSTPLLLTARWQLISLLINFSLCRFALCAAFPKWCGCQSGNVKEAVLRFGDFYFYTFFSKVLNLVCFDWPNDRGVWRPQERAKGALYSILYTLRLRFDWLNIAVSLPWWSPGGRVISVHNRHAHKRFFFWKILKMAIFDYYSNTNRIIRCCVFPLFAWTIASTPNSSTVKSNVRIQLVVFFLLTGTSELLPLKKATLVEFYSTL